MKHKISGLAVSVVTHGILIAGAVLMLCQISEHSPIISVADLVVLPPEPKPVPSISMPKTTVSRTNTDKHGPARAEAPPKPTPPAVSAPQPPAPAPVPIPPPVPPPAPQPKAPDTPASGQRSQEPAPVPATPATPAVAESATIPTPVPAPAPQPKEPDSPAGGQRSRETAPAPAVAAPSIVAESAPAAEPAYSELSDADYGRISSHLAPYIQRSYTRRANLRGLQGSVSISFRITTDGQAADVRVEKSSGSDELDACALSAIRKAAPYPPLGREVRLLLPVTYRLR